MRIIWLFPFSKFESIRSVGFILFLNTDSKNPSINIPRNLDSSPKFDGEKFEIDSSRDIMSGIFLVLDSLELLIKTSFFKPFFRVSILDGNFKNISPEPFPIILFWLGFNKG